MYLRGSCMMYYRCSICMVHMHIYRAESQGQKGQLPLHFARWWIVTSTFYILYYNKIILRNDSYIYIDYYIINILSQLVLGLVSFKHSLSTKRSRELKTIINNTALIYQNLHMAKETVSDCCLVQQKVQIQSF